ncbi:MAG: type II toxin-antitoxin system HigB family toxin [Candidatus Sumerlaeia bacterium]|nr:type II toxin-antitoxin system HigB family toxin [Candidatus Sumerlaeia bacterium]
MHVISRRSLRAFWERHPDAEAALEAWFHEAKRAHWASSADIKARYGTASIIGSERVVFNICGNRYRLIVRVNYESQALFIRFVGTHKEYDKIDARTV